ncbi:alpha/beta hydrolase [Streptacidiphilus pinicola]|uniref:Alpha/beta hydrolase n=1 Tax=Streptacidiphilus pinicola TaxID=2219663 RepID=A0A2X0I684_9ACTN|nr:alpha/beta hydrolase [Streptacidiphilus pinicola]RAG80482.1 alpha/beta hydrolase [Streptacidiphilus pinicola]
MSRSRRTAGAAAAVLALSLALPITVGGVAAAAPRSSTAAADPSSGVAGAQLALPRPTGPHAVGADVVQLVDADRLDPWVPAAGPRRLMVSIYYPARPGTGTPAPYMTTDEARLLLQLKAPGVPLPPERLAGTRTWAFADAAPAGGRFPLVLLSPGFTMPRQTLTGLAVELASHGYVVALVNHTYEDSGTVFPDGQIRSCVVCQNIPGGFAALEESRAADLSFVLDQLTAHPSHWRYAKMIDHGRIGIAGHSAGGASAATTMAADARVRAGVDLDGQFDVQPAAGGVGSRPFLLMGSETHTPSGPDPSWGHAWTDLTGWKRWLTITGAAHVSFTDLADLAAQAGYPLPGILIAAPRAEQLTREYVTAFFDRQLKERPEPLLDGPSSDNPEVRFQQPQP